MKKNKYYKLLSVLSILFILFSLCTVSVYADEANEGPSFKNGLAETVYNMAVETYDTKMLDEVKNLLTVDFKSGNFAGIWAKMKTVYDAMTSVGTVLLSLYFLLEMIEKTQTDNFNVEHFIKLCCKLLLGLGIMNKGLDLLGYGLSFGTGVMNYLTVKASTVPPAVLTELEAELTGLKKGISGSIAALGHLVKYLLPWAAMLICKVVIYMSVFSRIIELFARAMFAPIGMASIFEGGINSAGYRYFKKFVAVALQGAVIAAIVISMNQLQELILKPNNGLISSGGMVPITQCIIGFTSVTLILKSQSWANDIVGV